MNQELTQRRNALAETVRHFTDLPYCDEEIAEAARKWLDNMDDKAAGRKLFDLCKANGERDFTGTPFEQAWLDNGKKCPCECCAGAREVAANSDLF